MRLKITMKEDILMYNRTDLVELIKPCALKIPYIRAAWEGGSAATHRLDEFSDLDLTLVVDEADVEQTFTDFQNFITQHVHIIRSYRVPEPAWHGVSQCFYQIDQVTPYLYIDLAVMKKSHPDKLMEQDRHGQAVVWFDHDHVYDPSPSSQKVIEERVHKMIQSVAQTDFLIELEIEKGIARHEFLDVYPTYYSYISRHLAVMLNVEYRKERVDFGLRYARLDYAPCDIKLIQDAFAVKDMDELERNYVKIKQRYHELLTKHKT